MQNASEAGAEPILSAPESPPAAAQPAKALQAASAPQQPVEIGGPQGPEPTRFGDWERKGRCIDF